MYLKRLELHGFKSFASPFTFEFSPGVTCVVGPNGSGKTNVADAIRWVLGEQANRVIRARKTEDVIFSGSDKRSAQGMAEVGIVLDNSDGWLPLAYEEVIVSRRAYRSGDNEYYINQSRVRLKDVTELFMKAQVGQNSYAFMGQGLVEEVLTLRPEDRRGLIEQAADVRLHRTKLDEASRRLAATLDNLERIAMLVAEIGPRLRQLERQANRAEIHARLSAELAETLQTWFGQQWQEAQEALAAARAVLDQRQEEFDSARRELQACEEGISSLTGAIEERRTDIAGRLEAGRSLEDYRRDLQRRTTMDKERRSMLTNRRDELAGEIERLRPEREELTLLVGQQDERGQALEQELAAARIPEAQAQETERLESELRERRRQLMEREKNAAQAGARLAEAEPRIAALDEQQRRQSDELASLQEARGKHLASLKSWARELASLQERYTELAPLARRATRTLSETEIRLNESSAAVARQQDEVRTLSVEIESAQARLEVVEGMDVELPAADAGVRALLAAGGKLADEEPTPDSHIHGLDGMVGQLIRVPSGLERAIEAALAESLHAIVVETQDDALAAVELLVSENLGRATVFPLSDLQPGHALNLMEERGVIGVASELVRCDRRYRSLVDALLGRTIIVENLGIAKRLLRRGLGSIVTLDGILLRPMGSLTAGSAKAIRRAFVHQRDLGELPGELERLRATHQEAAATLETAQRELAETQQARDTLAADLDRMRTDLAKAEEALRGHRSRLPATASRLAAIHAHRLNAQRALGEAERGLDAARRDIESARGQTQEHEAALLRLRGEVEEAASTHEALVHAAAEAPTRPPTPAGGQPALSQLRTSQTATLARLEQELAKRTELASSLEEELKAVLARLEATQQELEEKSQEATAASEELAPARHALEQLESRQRTINDEVAAARSSDLAAERARLDAEANVRLRSEEIDALRARLEEDGFRPSDEGEITPLEAEASPPDWLTTDAASTSSAEAPSAEGDAEPPLETEPEHSPESPAEPSPTGSAESRGGDEELPPMRGGAQPDPTALKERVAELRAEIRSLGPVNEQAQVDYAENRERYDYLSGQLDDLRQAEASLQEAIVELERIIKERFSATFQQVNREFQRYFETFFGGGQAELTLTKAEGERLPGIEIMAQPPRKKVRSLNMLSGGERSLTAVALLFALLHTHPSPICVLDEVDAALDDSNVDRFAAALRDLAQKTQFIIITHNRRTVEMADTIYGISMGEDSTSAVLSLRLSDVQVS